jgi:4'-phosphopantetheinyl transferase
MRPEAVVHLVSIPREPQESDVALLSREERREASRFRFVRDRSSFVTARAAARRYLAVQLGTAPHRVTIVRDSAGRPRLRGNAADDIDFNISHSGSLAAVALSCGRRIGVDVERRRADRDLRSLVPDVMGPCEREMLHELDDARFVRAFYACWTRKEAIVKAIGAGIGYPLTGIDLPALPAGGVVRVAAQGLKGTEQAWSVRTLERSDGFTLSVALEGSGGGISLAGHIEVTSAPGDTRNEFEMSACTEPEGFP